MFVYHDKGKIIATSHKLISLDCDLIQIDGLDIEPLVLIRDYKIKNGQLIKKNIKVDFMQAKIAFVCVWGIACGISTYSEFIVNALRKKGLNVKIFAEHKPDEVNDVGILHCWNRGKDLSPLSAALKKYDPDYIYVQHEYGIFPDARHWTKFVSFLNHYNYVVAFHSVYKHQDKTVCEVICNNIIVHSDIAQSILQEKGVEAEITVIPHGCVEGKDLTRLWNIYRSPHTLMQFGFGFEYKGWTTALEAVKLLKDKYPDIFYLVLFSESNFSVDYHDSQFAKLEKVIEELGLQEHVAAIRGFQPEAVIDTFLRVVRVAIFPYTSHPDHIVYGSTGAARIAMANGTPTITSTLPLFYDLKDIVPQINNAQELADALDKMFSDNKYYEELRQKEIQYVRDNSWEKVADKYLAVWDD